MRGYIGEFLTARRAENSAPNTIRAYAGDLEQVAQFVGSEDWAEKLTRTVVRGFVAWYSRKAAAVSVGRKLHALKAFTSWLRTEGILSDDVCRHHISAPTSKTGKAARCPESRGDGETI